MDTCLKNGKRYTSLDEIYEFMEKHITNLPKLYKPAALNAMLRACDKALFFKGEGLTFRVNFDAKMADFLRYSQVNSSNRGRHSSYRFKSSYKPLEEQENSLEVRQDDLFQDDEEDEHVAILDMMVSEKKRFSKEEEGDGDGLFYDDQDQGVRDAGIGSDFEWNPLAGDQVV